MVKSIVQAYKGVDVTTASDDDKKRMIKYYEQLYPVNVELMDKFLKPLSSNQANQVDIWNIKFIAYGSPEPYHSAIFLTLPQVKLKDNTNSNKSQRYEGLGKREIYVNFNSIGDCRTFFHEVGHAVDHQLGSPFVYLSADLFNTLESDVFGHIEGIISDYSNDNANDEEAVLEAFKYNGDPVNLTTQQRVIYDEVVDKYHKNWDNNGNYITITDTYGGFTENKLIINPITGIRVFAGHEAVNSIGEAYWYNEKKDNPTGAQNREFFANNFADIVMYQGASIKNNATYYPNSTIEMDEMVQNAVYFQK